MTDIAEKLEPLAAKIDANKGPLHLLAMFFRDDAPPTWDLVVSAAGLHQDRWSDLDFVSRALGAALNRDEILTVSRILIFEPRDSLVKTFLKDIRGRRGYVDLPGGVGGSPVRAVVVWAKDAGESFTGPRKYGQRVTEGRN